MKKLLILSISFWLLVLPISAQESIYLPLVLKGNAEMAIPDPILRISAYLDDELISVDLLGPGSGWQLEDPYWRPSIAQPKGGGDYVSSALAPGQRLVSAEDGNVVESIPLSVRGYDQAAAAKTLRELLQLIRQARDYWTESWEYESAWVEVRPACNDCFTAYARITQASIPDIDNIFGQPFFSAMNDSAILDGITLTVEREPYWRALPPGEIIGPLYNYLRNPDFELWNFGVADSQPDSWLDLEAVGITGTNNRQTDGVKYGQAALRVEVRQSTAANQVKGVSQTAEGPQNNQALTMLAWIRSEGVSNGVGRLLVTSHVGTYEVYNSADAHGWRLYTQVLTTGVDDDIGVHAEILTTGPNCDGTIYFDGLMLVSGDWEQEAIDGVLPWMSSSHIVNHWDQPSNVQVGAGDINWVDAWEVPGDAPALVRLEVENFTTPSDLNDPTTISKIRIGQRRTRDVFNFLNYHDPVGVADVTASSDDRVDVTNLSPSWKDVTSRLLTDENETRDNQGRFRVLARVYDTIAGSPTLDTRLKYFIGAAGTNEKNLEPTRAPIRGEWCIVNITPNAAMNQDFKFIGDEVGQFGFIVQMKRDTGSDNSRFDYALIMPTDGGYLEAEIDPPLALRGALVADATAVGPSVYGVYANVEEWILDWSVNDANALMNDLVSFNGDLYVCGASPAIVRNTIWRQRDGVWSLVLSVATGSDFKAMAVYNGVLYAAQEQLPQGIIWSTTDGVSWTQVHTLLNNTPSPNTMVVFDGLLWVGTGAESGAPFNSFLETFDGAAWATVRTYGGVNAAYQDLIVYGGKLYAIPGLREVESYNPLGGWQLEYVDLARLLFAFGLFDGKLYVGTGNNGEIVEFDGANWTGIEVVPGAGLRVIRELTSYRDLFFVAEQGGDVYQSSDGTDWNLSIAAPDIAGWTSSALGSYNGVLWYCSSSGGYIYRYAKVIKYAISDFQGTVGFTAPNRRLPGNPRRHRWVFSYDRENYVNNIDDAALIGLGYVPRYLSPMRGDD